MQRHHEPVDRIALPDEREADQRWPVHRERHDALGVGELRQPGLTVGRVQSGQIVVGPGRRRFRRDDRHRGALGVRHKCTAQVRVSRDQRLGAAPHAFGIHPGQIQDHLCRIDIHITCGQFGVEQQPVLQRGERPDVGDVVETPLYLVDLTLPQVNQLEVRRRQTTRSRRDRVQRNGFQSTVPQLDEAVHRLVVENRRGVVDRRRQLRSRRRLGHHRVDVESSAHRHGRTTGTADGLVAVRDPRTRSVGSCQASEIVEGDSRVGSVRESFCALVIEVAEQTVADAAPRDGGELLLHRLDQTASGLPTRKRVIDVDSVGGQEHRVQGGEPADRARQVGAGQQLFLSAVTLQCDDERGRRLAASPQPVGRGQRECGQQSVVHATVECLGHPGQQRVGQLGREHELPVLEGSDQIPIGLNRQTGIVDCRRHRSPVVEFVEKCRIARQLLQTMSPPAHRCAHRIEPNRLPRGDLSPCRREIG